jgi:hypothetical protein
LNWNLADVAFGFFYGHAYLQYTVLELGARFLGIGAIGQRDGPVEFAISALGPGNSALRLGMFELALTPDYDGVVADLNRDIFVRETWQFGRHDVFAVSLGDFDGWDPECIASIA